MVQTAEQRGPTALLDDRSAGRFPLLLSGSILLHVLILLLLHVRAQDDRDEWSRTAVLTVDIVSPEAVPVLPPPLPGAYPSVRLPEAMDQADAAAVPPPSPLAPIDALPDTASPSEDGPEPAAPASGADPLSPSTEMPEATAPIAPSAEALRTPPPELLAEALVPAESPPPPLPPSTLEIPARPGTDNFRAVSVPPTPALEETSRIPLPEPAVPPPPPDEGIQAPPALPPLEGDASPSFIPSASSPEPPPLPPVTEPPTQRPSDLAGRSTASSGENVLAAIPPPRMTEVPAGGNAELLQPTPPSLEESAGSSGRPLTAAPPPANEDVPSPSLPPPLSESVSPPASEPVPPPGNVVSVEAATGPPAAEPVPAEPIPVETTPESMPLPEPPVQLAGQPDQSPARAIEEVRNAPAPVRDRETYADRLDEAETRLSAPDTTAPSTPDVPARIAETRDHPLHVAEGDRPADPLPELRQREDVSEFPVALGETPDLGMRLQEARPAPPPASRRQAAAAPSQPPRREQLATLPPPPLPAGRPVEKHSVILPGLDCGWVEAEIDNRSGAVSLSGHVSSDAERMRMAEQVTGQLKVPAPINGNRVAVLPSPGCRVAERLRRAGIGMSPEMERQLFQNNQPGRVNAVVFRSGERIMIDLQTPSFPAYVYVDHYETTGTVRHLYPSGNQGPNRLDPGQLLRIGGAATGPLIAAPPFGLEAVVAIGASAPIFSLQRPEVEPASRYLATLGSFLERRRAADPAFKAEFYIRYIEKTP
jgi:hypothetical protein